MNTSAATEVHPSVDRFLHVALPLPLTRLHARAMNSVSARDRQLAGYFLLEATLKLASSVEVSRYLHQERRDPAIDQLLLRLALPSIGHWAQILREISQFFGDESPIYGALAARREDLPAIRSCLAYLTDRVARNRKIAVSELFDTLPAFRNRTLGHGALSRESAADEGGRLLLGALEELVRETTLFEHLSFLVLEESRIADDGGTEVIWGDLTGPFPTRLTPTTVISPDVEIRPLRVYARRRDAHHLPLHPLVVFRPDEFNPRLLLLNGSHRQRKAQYLDYATGAVEDITSASNDRHLLQDLRDFLGRIRKKPLSASEHAALEETSLDSYPSADLGEPPPSNMTFGNFDLLGELGRGAMGIVHLARQRSLDRFVALKMFPPELTRDDVAAHRFRREIAALGRCDHPNVITVLDSGTAEGTPYYAMELVVGTTLEGLAHSLLSSTSLDDALRSACRSQRESLDALPAAPAPSEPEVIDPPAETLKQIAAIVAAAARGLHHLHEQGIIHRDIKPANIMVAEENRRVVLMDLGLAAVEGMSFSRSIQGGGLLGTLRYMAPEQLLRSRLDVDRRADVYSLGATLYELTTGRPVFEADSEPQIIQQILHREASLVSLPTLFDGSGGWSCRFD